MNECVKRVLESVIGISRADEQNCEDIPGHSIDVSVVHHDRQVTTVGSR